MPIDDRKSAALPIGRQRADGVTGEFVVSGLANDDEQPILPRRRKDSWDVHKGILVRLVSTQSCSNR